MLGMLGGAVAAVTLIEAFVRSCILSLLDRSNRHGCEPASPAARCGKCIGTIAKINRQSRQNLIKLFIGAVF
jgi:hypothetical protein